MPGIQEQALRYISSPPFEDLLNFLAKRLTNYGVNYLTNILDEKLEEYKVPLEIREIIKWAMEIASQAFIVWFEGKPVAVSIAKYLLNRMINTLTGKLYHVFINPPTRLVLECAEPNRVSIALSPKDAEVLKLNLIEEVESGQYKDDPDCRKYLRILKKYR